MTGRVSVALAAVALAFAGCATARPTITARAVPFVGERMPLRVGLLIPEEEAQKRYVQDLQVDIMSFAIDLDLATPLHDALLMSFSQAFERVTILRAPPKPGEYHAVLAPRIVETKWDSSSNFFIADITFTLRTTLDALDQAGRQITSLRGDAVIKRSMGATTEIAEQTGPMASEALNQVIRRLVDRLGTSAEIQRYVAALRPTLTAAQPVARPPASDIAVSLSYPADGARVQDEQVTIVGLVSTPRGVGRLEIAVNGRPVPVSRDVRVQATDIKSHPFTAQIPLSVGRNLITLTAVDASGNAAQAVRTVFREVTEAAGTVAPKLGTGERWAVVIGIDQYRDPAISALRYATADAESVFRFLTTRGGVKPANARLLLNKDATQRNIRQVLGDFLRQKALRDDEVVIYYAGHGTTEPDQSAEGGVAKYLVPWDADPQSLFSTAIPMEEIDRVFGRLAARKILMIQDTCFSGGAGGRTFLAKGLSVRTATLTDKFLQELTQKEGRMILTASDVNQVSQEDPALGHGIFTHYFLEALGGAADLDADGAVTVREVHLYLQRKVHERSGGAQTPQLYNIGDMVLVRK